MIRDYQPIGVRILVRIKEDKILEKYKKNSSGTYEEITESGFVIPTTKMEYDANGRATTLYKTELSEDDLRREYLIQQEGYVVRMGPNVFHDMPGNHLEEGDLINFAQHSGDFKIQMGDDGCKYTVIKDIDVYGTYKGENLNER